MYPSNKVLQNEGDEERKLRTEYSPIKFYTSRQTSFISFIIGRLLKIKLYTDSGSRYLTSNQTG